MNPTFPPPDPTWPGLATPSDTPALPPVAEAGDSAALRRAEAHELPQLYAHLVRLAAAADREAVDLASIRTVLDRIDGVLAALTEHLTDVTRLRAFDEHVADLATRLEAGEAHLNAVSEAVTRLGRTQFKSNALAEAQDERVGAALATLQTIATHRENTSIEARDCRQQDVVAARAAGRGEMAADLLPSLDGLEAALVSGRTLIERQRAARAAAAVAPAPPAPRGLVARLRSVAGSAPAPPPPPAPPPAVHLDALAAWLAGLDLVRDRLLALLALEEIAPIDPLGQTFDAHLHVAITTAARSDVPAGTVVDVLRRGYRQGARVLRYAEVSVARPATEPAPSAPLRPPAEGRDNP